MKATLTSPPGAARRAVELDLAALRRRFSAGAAPPDMLYGDQGTRPAAAASTPASVLVPIVARSAELTVLFTRRTEQLRSHSGQIAFPGGRAEAHDPSAEATALREAAEEIGLDAARVELLGRLSDYHTRTGFRVTPVVGVVSPPFELQPDAGEVDEVFEVPLSFLLDPRNHQIHSRELHGATVRFFAIPYAEHYIWGATAGMLVNLYRFLATGT